MVVLIINDEEIYAKQFGKVLTAQKKMFKVQSFEELKKEKQVSLPTLVAIPFLFILGAAVVYYVISPIAWNFFLYAPELIVFFVLYRQSLILRNNQLPLSQAHLFHPESGDHDLLLHNSLD